MADRLRTYLAVVCLLVFSGGIFQASRSLKLLVYASVGWAAWSQRALLWQTLRRERTLLMFATWAALTITWSVDPAWSLRRWIGLVGSILVGAWIAQKFKERERMKLLGAALNGALWLSVLAVGFFPLQGVATDPFHYGLWQGIFFHKNRLGMVAGLAVLVHTLLTLEGSEGTLIWPLSLLCSSYVLVLSGSKAPMLSCGLLLLGCATLWAIRRQRARAIGALAVSAFLLVALVWVGSSTRFPSTKLLPPLGLPQTQPFSSGIQLDTATGRTPVWGGVLRQAQRRPLRGYGYGAFWLDSGPGPQIENEVRWSCKNAHNGYLDVLAATGAVGLLWALAGLGLALRRHLARLLSTDGSITALWPLCWLGYFVLINSVESVYFEPHALFLVLYSCSLCVPCVSGLAEPADASKGSS